MTELHLISLVSDDYDDGFFRQPVCAVFGEEQAKQVIAQKIKERAEIKIILAENQKFYEQFITEHTPAYFNLADNRPNHQRYTTLSWKVQWDKATLSESEQAEVDAYIEQVKHNRANYEQAYNQWVNDIWKPAYLEFCGKMGRDVKACEENFDEQISMGNDMEDDGDYEITIIEFAGNIPAELLVKI